MKHVFKIWLNLKSYENKLFENEDIILLDKYFFISNYVL